MFLLLHLELSQSVHTKKHKQRAQNTSATICRGNYDPEIQVEVAQGGTQAHGTYLQLEMLVL